jgi:hypothetical protein
MISKGLEMISRALEMTSKALGLTSRALEMTSRALEMVARALEMTGKALADAAERLPRPAGFPNIGQAQALFFQGLENLAESFPRPGKNRSQKSEIRGQFSEAWKNRRLQRKAAEKKQKTQSIRAASAPEDFHKSMATKSSAWTRPWPVS